jgi:hypothetical protein
MAENGGTTTQSGIHYQNSIAALYLGRLIDFRQRIASERVVEVRVEAPTHVDDVVVSHADGGRTFIQAKESITSASDAWTKLWSDFAEQGRQCADVQFKLVLAVGTYSAEINSLRELCDRAKGKRDTEEWTESLSIALKAIVQKVVAVLPERTEDAAFRLVRHIEVWIWPLDSIVRERIPLWIPPSSATENTLFTLLLGRVGGQARIRGIFNAIDLLNKLADENELFVHDSTAWGSGVYLQTIRTEMGILAVPGTNLRGPIEDLFLWLPLREDRPGFRKFWQN